ncbi:MAG TPA: TAXI family TRAP transporter solute-binding subunit [Acetobacteraceae bacterium]|nr:TAXI family TRAP transporter solute-binding subunit [Acetobacteraceae bacterium]
MMRRAAMSLAAVLPLAVARAQQEARPQLALATGAPGGTFHVYGEALADILARHSPAAVTARVTGGSNENIRLLDSGAVAVGLVAMGPAFEAWNGTGPFAGAPRRNLRALFPMYETPFAFIALRRSGISRVADLDGRRVGVGPAGGPTPLFFAGLAEEAGIRATAINGSPDDHARQLLAGEIDAFWFGAGLPVAAFTQVADAAEATVFGMTDAELAGFRRRFGYMAPNTIPAGTYRGQDAPVRTAAVWNFVVASPTLAEPVVHGITAAALSQTAVLAARIAAGAATIAANATANTFLPFHPGAARHYREAGIALPAALTGG